MDLKCSKCKVVRHKSHFSKRKDPASKRGYASQCNVCKNKYRKRLRKIRTSEGYYVYYLPEEHYCGVTAWLGDRMIAHRKNRSEGDRKVIRKTEGWRVLFHTFELAEAKKVEAEFHMLGMNGLKAL